LIASRIANEVVESPLFSFFIFGCIVLASVLVGLETYPDSENSNAMGILDTFVLTAFSFEVILKLLREGKRPLQYFFGSDSKWNSFDFVIVACSLILSQVSNYKAVKLFRIIRLFRLAKFFQKVKPLRKIVEGLLGGLKSMLYIVILLGIIFYIYAIAGMYFFRENDPWHYRSIEITLTTLMGYATLSVSFFDSRCFHY